MIDNKLREVNLSKYELILVPGFIQFDLTNLEKRFSLPIRKGTEFASDLPLLLKKLENITLSNKISADRVTELNHKMEYQKIVKEMVEKVKKNLGSLSFYINKSKYPLIISKTLPPPIIAEIVDCTNRNNRSILKKVKHYIESGADIIDIGCVTNNSNPDKVKEIIKLIRENFDILLSIDSMNKDEILAAVSLDIDMILSMDQSTYTDFIEIPKDIPIVILPTKIKNGYFPKNPQERVKNLFILTKKMKDLGFRKLIADPLLETPLYPGVLNSLQAYSLYKEEVKKDENKELELPLFFGISNVVELMDIDSVGINGLLASIAMELDIGILFTTEHSKKLFGGVRELKQCLKLNYISKYRNTPPINQGIQIFKAKGKKFQENPLININNSIEVSEVNQNYIPDEKGYFKIYIDHYNKKIYVMFFSNDNKLLNLICGNDSESLCKKIIELKLIKNMNHINYLGRETKKAEIYLHFGKPYIQDDN